MARVYLSSGFGNPIIPGCCRQTDAGRACGGETFFTPVAGIPLCETHAMEWLEANAEAHNAIRRMVDRGDA